MFIKKSITNNFCFKNTFRLFKNSEYLKFKDKKSLFELKDSDEILLNSDGNTVVKLKDNNNICNVDTNFTAAWGDYDIDWAIRFGNSKKFTFDNLSNLHLDELNNLNWNLLDYHNKPIPGFRIYNIKDMGAIILNGIEFKLNFGIPTSSDIDLNNFNYDKIYESWKWNRATELLNNCNLEIFKRFEYTNINNRYIQAISKTKGDKSLVQVEFSGGLSGSKDSYPKTNLTKWEQIYFPGENNPAMWNHLKRGLLENNSEYINQTNSNEITSSFLWNITGSFNYDDIFIRNKHFEVPKATTVFFIFDNQEFITDQTEYLWEIWEENHGKLMMRSRKHYFIWTFIDKGKYSVTLNINNQLLDDYKIEKKSFITIT